MIDTPSFTASYQAHVRGQIDLWSEALLSEGYDAVVVLAGEAAGIFLDDQHYPFKANPHLLAWAPLDAQPGSALILQAGHRPQLYLHQESDFWHAPAPPPADWWAQEFDLHVNAVAGAWRQSLPQGRIALIDPDSSDISGIDTNPAGLIKTLHLQRTRKTPYEVACLRQAERLACRGHAAAKDAFFRSGSEFDIHCEYLSAVGQLDNELPYPSIVALNHHAAVLHYQHRDRNAPEAHNSFLLDAGARFHGYCADISRTYCNDGPMSELVLQLEMAQQALCDRARAGLPFPELHRDAHLAVGDILSNSDIARGTASELLECGLARVFMPHGLGHFLGLQVHDVAGHLNDAGEELPPSDEFPHLRLTRALQAGNVLTIEPGIYFIDTLLEEAARGPLGKLINWTRIDELRPYGGVRIEDNLLITESGSVNLTREAWAETVPV